MAAEKTHGNRLVYLLFALTVFLGLCIGCNDIPPAEADGSLPEESLTISNLETDVSEEDSAQSDMGTESFSQPEQEKDPAFFKTLTSKSGTYYRYSGINQFRVDNQGFSFCGYSEQPATNYAFLVNKTAEALKGQATVYSLVIPTAYGVVLPDDISAQIEGYTGQDTIIEKIYAPIDPGIKRVNCWDNMMAHRSEYLYFRTDHHWNGRGAYYAYEAFCETKGIVPHALDEYREVQFEGFLGTVYSAAKEDTNLLPADTVYAYHPISEDAAMVIYTADGEQYDWPIIKDVTDYSAGMKYNTYAGSDSPLAVFTNPQVPDGSVLIVVKDSFGNALLPFLVDHYSTIHEIDFRYWKGNLIDYAKEIGATDILFANNVMMVSTDSLVGRLSMIVNPR